MPEISGSAHTDPALWPDDSNHGAQNIGFFRQLGELLLLRIHSLRQLEQLLILLCFFSSMLITNDGLNYFVPFALELLRMVNRKDRIVPVVICQTLAANLGSMTTPVRESTEPVSVFPL